MAPTAPACGNAVCDAGETADSCPHDCTSIAPSILLPPPCIERHITDQEECRKLMEELNAPVGTTTAPVGPVCGNKICETAKGETPDKCAIDCPREPVSSIAPAIQLPKECIDRKITDPTACKRLMEELNAPVGATTAPAGPVCGNKICETAKGETPDKCAIDCPRFGTTEGAEPLIQFPKECVEKGIKDPAECKRLVDSLHASGTQTVADGQLPELCRLKSIKDPSECKALMAGVFRSADEQSGESGTPAGTGRDDGRFGFSAMLPKACVEAKIADPAECKALMRSEAARTAAAHVPPECEAKGLKTADDCRKFFEERAVLPECKKLGAKTLDECKSLLAAQNLPVECRDKGIADEKECRALLQKSYMPKTCDAQGAKTLGECRPMLLEKYGRPDQCAGLDDDACWRLIEAGKVDAKYHEQFEKNSKAELPEKCLESGASNYEECERTFEERDVPSECRDAGIFARSGCEKHLFEKSRTDIAAALPEECAEAGVADPDACKKLMEARYFPSECADEKIADLAECKRLLVLKHMPKECREAGIETKLDCEKLLRDRLMTPACEAQGIVTKEACEEFIYGHVSGGVTCQGLGPEECALAMKGRHLGAILHANEQLAHIEKEIDGVASDDGEIDLAALAIRGDDTHARVTKMLPMRPRSEHKLRALKSSGQIAVNDDDTVDAAAGTLIAYDTDGDGLPDDVELRHGLDPEKADTDADGESDQDELKKKKPKGFDKALVDDQPIGQPLTEGDTDPSLTVMLMAEGDAADEAATVLSGTGTPGEVITLYVYSELPMVVTTTVDDNGQWSYELQDGLQEGTHEVYVAVNDDTGKVVRKSDPLSLLIRGASAATVAEAASLDAGGATAIEAALLDAQANAAEGANAELDVRVFLFGGAALVLAAVLIATSLVLRKRKKDGDRQDGNMLT